MYVACNVESSGHPSSRSSTVRMPLEPHEEILFARGTHTLEIATHELPNHHDPLSPVPGAPTIAKESQIDVSTPLDGGTYSLPSKNGPESTPLHEGAARLPNFIGRFMNWWGNSTHIPNRLLPESQPYSLKPSSYVSVIILHPEDNSYPVYNLDAKLGEREGHSSIEFLCSASCDTDSSFREIKLEIELFHLGNVNPPNTVNVVAQRSIPGNARNPIKPVGFYPKGPQRSNQIDVERKRNMGGKANLGGGVGGVNTALELSAERAMQYTIREGVTFNGQHLSKSKVGWIWKADGVVRDGLEDNCKFWVTIPKVKKGVKADFKVTCRVRGPRSKLTLPANHKKVPAHELELHFDSDATTQN